MNAVKTFVLSSAVLVVIVLTLIFGVFMFILGEFLVLIISETDSALVLISKIISTAGALVVVTV